MLPLDAVTTNITGWSLLSVSPLMPQVEPEQSADSDMPDPA